MLFYNLFSRLSKGKGRKGGRKRSSLPFPGNFFEIAILPLFRFYTGKGGKGTIIEVKEGKGRRKLDRGKET
jgi:hypothetical protein